MPRIAKFLIGLAATGLMTWLSHGPMGGGEAVVNRLETEARAAVAESEVPGVQVQLGRDPLSREAILSGPADQFQREGQGSLKGLNDVVGEIEGVSGVRWSNPPPVLPASPAPAAGKAG